MAFALRSAVAADPRLSPNVRRMVAGWYGNRDAPNQQATAARVHGVAYGETDPAAAVDALDRLTVINHIRVSTAVGDSLADLLAGGTDDLACVALQKLAESVHDPERSPAVQLAFLVLAVPLDKEVPADEGGQAVSWPLLLDLMARVGAARPPIVSLWQYVLSAGLLQRSAEQVMTSVGDRGRRRSRPAPGLPAYCPGDRG